MSWLDVLKLKKTPASEAPASPQETAEEFRAREKAASEVENEGIPSVNKRKSGNSATTTLGIVFILVVGGVFIVSVNKEKPTQAAAKKMPKEGQVANTMAPFVAPALPPEIALIHTTAAVSATAPASAASAPQQGQGGAQVPPIAMTLAGPIPLQAGRQGQAAMPSQAPNGKAPPDWTDRKLKGELLIEGDRSSRAAGPAPARLTPESSDGQSLSGFGAAGAGRRSDQELSTLLEPTVTKAVSAALLPNRNFLITKGASLDCALETALDSTLPGLTTCRLTRDIYSDNGQVLLLDRGSQLVGEYQGGLKQGQRRVFILWTRVKTPNGVVVSLNSPSADSLGRTGAEGWVDNHFMERFGAAILMSFVKDSVSAIASKSGSGTTNIYGNSAEEGSKLVEKILESTVNIPPTLIKNQGDHIQVMVARDLDFSGVYALRVSQ